MTGAAAARRAAAALLFIAAAAGPAAGRLVDGVVAVVNDEPVTFSEFRDHVAEGLGIPTGDADIYLREERDGAKVVHALEGLIETVLVRQELKRAGHEVAEAEVDRAVESVRKANNMTEAELKAALARDGISVEGYRRRIRWQIERGAIIRARKQKEVSVTEDELRAFFKDNGERFLRGAEVRVDSLLLPLPERPVEEEALVRLRIAGQRALEYVQGGMTLADAARLLSSAVPGAEVLSADYLAVDDMVPEIGREVARLRTGETSPPFLTEAGVHLVTVLGRRGGTPRADAAAALGAAGARLGVVRAGHRRPPPAGRADHAVHARRALGVRAPAGVSPEPCGSARRPRGLPIA